MARVDILNYRIEKSLFLLAWPLVLSSAFQTIYNMVDSYFLGKLGPVEFSASTIVWPVIFVFLSLAIGFSNAGISLISQFYGKRDYKNARLSMVQLYAVTVSVGVVSTVVGIILADPIIRAIAGNSQERLIKLAIEYYVIDMIGLPFVFIFNSTTAVARAVGDSKFSMRIMGLMNLINLVFDPLLIFGIGFFPKLGVAGAAWASNIGRFFAAAYSMYYILKKDHLLKIERDLMKVELKLVKKIIAIGLPNSLGASLTSAGFAVVMRYVAQFGPAVISAYGIGNRVTNLVNMFSFGIGGAVAVMVGQFIGARRYEGAEKTVFTAFLINLAVIGTVCTMVFFFAPQITKFFINDPQVIDMGRIYFRYISFSIPIFTSYMVYNNALIGAGKGVLIMIQDILRLWGIRIPIIAALSTSFGFKGVFVGMIISNLCIFVLSYIFFKFSNWRKGVVDEKVTYTEKITQ